MNIYQQDVPFCKAKIWQQHKDYYLKQGQKAWNCIPFYVTSNSYIATHYARLVCSLLLESQASGKLDSSSKIYLLELGVGHGQFSYYFVQHLHSLLLDTGIEFNYILTDCSTANLHAMNSHKQWHKLIEQGLVDFAVLDTSDLKPVQLMHAKLDLASLLGVNPLIVIANYFFDSLVHDLLEFKQGKVKHVNISVTAKKQSQVKAKAQKLKKDHKFIAINNCDIFFKTSKKYNGYQHDILDKLVAYYTKHIKDSRVFIPLDGIKLLDFLTHLSRDKLVLLATDKSSNNLEALEDLSNWIRGSIVGHDGAFSLTTNVHALGYYFEYKAGTYLMPQHTTGLNSVFMSMGLEWQAFPITKRALDFYWQQSANYYHKGFYEVAIEVKQSNLAMHQLLAVLSMGCYDPQLFDDLYPALCKQIKVSGDEYKQKILDSLHNISKLVYYVPGHTSVWFNLAYLYHELEEYQLAIDVYYKAIDLKESVVSSWFNLGLCYESLEDKNQALMCFFKTASARSPTAEQQKVIELREELDMTLVPKTTKIKRNRLHSK